MVIDRIKYRWHKRRANRLYNKAKEIWRLGGSKYTWYGPSLVQLSPKEMKQYNHSRTRQYQLRGPSLGMDVSGMDLDVKRDPSTTQPLDDVFRDYKEVLPTYYGPDGNPRPQNFVSDD